MPETGPEDVLAYLEAHPEFILDHPDVLLRSGVLGLGPGEEASAKVRSLREALFERLKEERESLRGSLEDLFATAQENESLQAKFVALEHRVLSANRLEALVEALAQDLAREFDLAAVHLALVRPQEGDPPVEENAHLSWVGPEAEGEFTGDGGRPLLRASPPPGSASFFPPPLAERVRSEALVPLRANGRFLGVLCLGSAQPSHYRPGLSTHLLERLAGKVALAVDRLEVCEHLRYLVSIDELTGLHNRRHFDRALGAELSRARRYGSPLGCVVLDLDDFKDVNDRWGHQAGDKVLRAVAGLIRSNMRLADLAFRYGGEEFVLLLPQADDRRALEAANRLWKHLLATEVELEGERVKIQASLGVASLSPRELEEGGDPFREADQALLEAKRRGKNCVVLAPGTAAE